MSELEGTNNPQRKRRTREHVLEDLSENHLERQVLLQGYVLRRPRRDYGVDVTMFHFADDGAIENGEVRFQLKATDALNVIHNGTVISIPIRTGDLHYWQLETYPFILVVFDAKTETAFWLHVQDYVNQHPDCLDPDQVSVQVHIPNSDFQQVDSRDRCRVSSEVIGSRPESPERGGISRCPQKTKMN